ncbi:MAG: 4Fe-4S cluster-binding domain-containing protein, partial [Succinivibrio sp.]|nr:4Fe-4S cluster-binding domain-containing protein [Succinivibrio sp.]
PLQQEDILLFIKAVKQKRIGVILFTGYEQSELSGDAKQAADLCDVVIYGRYIDKLKDDSLYLRGSLNQSIVFNTKKYKPKEFEKPNSYEVSITNDLELRGRTKELINDLLELNR